MKNQEAPSSKSIALYWLLFTTVVVLLTLAVLNTAGIGPQVAAKAPEAHQSAPAATPAAPASTVPTAAGSQVVGAGSSYTLTGNFLYGSQVAGETSFKPADVVPKDCTLTDAGRAATSMFLFQEAGQQSELARKMMDSYVRGSTIYLTNVRVVSGNNPYIVADSRIVPQTAPAPFPQYLEVKQARFRWSLPMVKNASGDEVGDPLISCNYT